MERYQHESVQRLVRELFRRLGCPDDVATAGAASLVDADLRGHGSQGVLRVPWIGRKIEDGEVDPAGRPTVDRAAGATVRIDGQSGLGQFVARRAVDEGVETAAENGVGVVGIRNANDLGRVGEWAERAAERGMILQCLVNARAHPTVAPNGCADRILSTNPVAFGIPTFDALDFPIVHDMATSQVAQGKIEEYDQRGTALPSEWTTTATGAPVDDPGAFLDGAGAILPLGGRATGHKGFGLGIVNELLAGILSGGTVAGEPDRPPSGNDAVFVVIDPTAFTSRDRLEAQIESFVAFLRSRECSSTVSVGDPATGDDGPLRLPGERSHGTYRERREAGIPLPEETVSGLRALAADLDCADAVPASFED
jgi:uncharacterized oxidoreductase